MRHRFLFWAPLVRLRQAEHAWLAHAAERRRYSGRRGLAALVLAASVLAWPFRAGATITVLSHWHMGDGDPGAAPGAVATTTTAAIGGQVMSLTGNPTYDTGVSAAAAAHTASAYCLRFSGTNWGTNALVNTGTDNFGIEMWVKPHSLTGTQALAYNGNTGSSGWGLYLAGATYSGLLGGVSFFGSGTTAALDTWTHLALVRTNGVSWLYVNGVGVSSTTLPPNPPTGVFGVAASPGTAGIESFNGWIDEVRVFTFAPGAFSINDLLLNASPPIVATGAASALSTTAATLSGSYYTPGSQPTAGWFEYGTTTSYGQSTTLSSGASNNVIPLAQTLSGLAPATAYHFRADASNLVAVVRGADNLFTTLGPAASAGDALSFSPAAQSSVSASLPTTYYSNYTLAAWVYLRSGSAGFDPGSAIFSTASCGDGMELLLRGGATTPQNIELGRCDYFVGNPSTNTVPLASWVHVAVTVGADQQINYFINGLPAGTWYPAQAVPIGPDLLVGANTGFRQFDGLLDEVEVWDTALTASQIRSTAMQSLVGTEPNLVLYLRFDEGSGSVTANSAAATGGYAALVNSPVWSSSGPIFDTLVTTLPASDVAAYSATLNGLVWARGRSLTGTFTWGLNAGSGQNTPPVFASGFDPVPVTMPITNLSSATTYHYQVVFGGTSGFVHGGDVTFTTGVLPLVATTNAVLSGLSDAVVSGTITPSGAETFAWAECRVVEGFVKSSPPVSVGSGLTASNVSFTVSGLDPGKIEYCRLVATNNGGPAQGDELPIVTPGRAFPHVPTGYDLGPFSANLYADTAAIENNEYLDYDVPALGWFVWGTNTDYGSASVPQTLSRSVNPIGYADQAANLVPGTVYHFSGVVSNQAGITYSDDLTFRTPSTNTVLTTVLVNGQPLSPPFDPAVSSYTLTVGAAVSNAVFYAAGPDPAVFLQVGYGNRQGAYVVAANGATSGPLALAYGDNYLYLDAHAEAPGYVTSYYLIITRLAPPPPPPTVQTLPPFGYSYGYLQFQGAVTPNGALTQLSFDERPNQLAWSSLFAGTASGTGQNVPFSNGLWPSPGTAYHYRAVAQSSSGLARGQELVAGLPVVTLSGPATMSVTVHTPFVDPGVQSVTDPMAITAIACGASHALALRGDGTVLGWGRNDAGQALGVASPPTNGVVLEAGVPLSNIVAIAAGAAQSYALRLDGTVAGWGDDSLGQLDGLAGLSNLVALAAGADFGLGLHGDGSAIAWGNAGAVPVPVSATHCNALAAGAQFCLALQNDGTVLAWGDNSYGQVAESPTPGLGATGLVSVAGVTLSNVTAIAAGGAHALALRADGSIVTWGMYSNNGNYVAIAPPGAVTNITAIAAGADHSLALRADGQLFDWGVGWFGETNPPPNLTNLVALAGGQNFSLALTATGKLIGWGLDDETQTNTPLDTDLFTGTLAVDNQVDTDVPGIYTVTYTASNAAGLPGAAYRTVIVPQPGLQPIQLSLARLSDGTMQVAFTNVPGASFTVQSVYSLIPFEPDYPLFWSALGAPTEGPPGYYCFIDDYATNSDQSFYRVSWP